jgi:hypothetical protein
MAPSPANMYAHVLRHDLVHSYIDRSRAQRERFFPTGTSKCGKARGRPTRSLQAPHRQRAAPSPQIPCDIHRFSCGYWGMTRKQILSVTYAQDLSDDLAGSRGTSCRAHSMRAFRHTVSRGRGCLGFETTGGGCRLDIIAVA